jgi:hypothetical protein
VRPDDVADTLANGLANPTFYVQGGLVRADYGAQAPEGTPFLFLWYVRDGANAPWIEIPDAREQIRATAEGGELIGAESGVFVSLRADPKACRRQGEYRLEIWAGDELVQSTVATLSGSDEPLSSTAGLGRSRRVTEVLDTQLCRPDDWELQRAGDGFLRITRPDGQAYVEIDSTPVGVLADAARLQAEAAALQELASDLGPATLEETLVTPFGQVGDRVVDVAFNKNALGRAATYRVVGPAGARIVIVGASFGADGILRTVQVEVPEGEADLAAALFATVRFSPRANAAPPGSG